MLCVWSKILYPRRFKVVEALQNQTQTWPPWDIEFCSLAKSRKQTCIAMFSTATFLTDDHVVPSDAYASVVGTASMMYAMERVE